MIAEKSMLLITSQREGAPTFRMMPLSNECPFIEGVYEPRAMALVLFYKHQVQGLHMVPQIDSNGEMVRAPKPAKDGNPYKQERKLLSTAHEAYITDKKEIADFISMIAYNQDFDYKKFVVDPKIQMDQPKIIMP